MAASRLSQACDKSFDHSIPQCGGPMAEKVTLKVRGLSFAKGSYVCLQEVRDLWLLKS